jgi:3-isopropylmalate/(R)-2-methylmalate dehydratase large subunit
LDLAVAGEHGRLRHANVAGKTISEKILSEKSGRSVSAGDVAICEPDRLLGTDAATPMAVDYFDQMGSEVVVRPEGVLIALDHYAPPSSAATAAFHDRVRDFAGTHGLRVCGVGDGISHQLAAELGWVRPGDLVVGADSHTVTLGALNAFATGIGSSDLAAALACGQVWLRVPETFRVRLEGPLQPGVTSKDVALAVLRETAGRGVGYTALELDGSGVADMEIDERFVVSNLVVEMGAKAGIFRADEATRRYLSGRSTDDWLAVESDVDADFAGEMVIDIAGLSPLVALPHDPTNVVEIDAAVGEPIDMAFLGTCSGGRADDFRRALAILRTGGGPAAGVRLVVTPVSREVHDQLLEDGTLDALRSMGAVITVPGCGPCCGTSEPIPAPGTRVMSTANRNYQGRMGDATASIYLASPETCAASAAKGYITDPRTMLET